MLIIREDLKRLKQATEKDPSTEIMEMFQWTKALAASGKYVHSDPLDIVGRYVSKNDVLSDGPFIEAKEGIAGYYVVLAANLDDAVSIAKTCPLVMRDEAVIEVRPVLPAPDAEAER
jgi:hypothetical protein